VPAAKPTISIDPDLYEAAKAAAEAAGTSFSAFVEQAIRRHFVRENARAVLAEYETDYGPIPEKVRAQVRREMGLPPRSKKARTTAA
jgi:hypothetical protein